MQKGIIIKGIGGLYDVKTEDNCIITGCRLRGRLKLKHDTVLVGDHCLLSVSTDGTFHVEEILPRRTSLVRPPIANIEQVVVVVAVQDPEPNQMLIDGILAMAEAEGLTGLICISKSELDPQKAEEIESLYSTVPYPVIKTSAKKDEGIEELKASLYAKISAFAGPSGVGKSSLLNKLRPELNLEVGEISKKLGRGKHTTRSVQLIPLESGGLVADTPGFSRLTLETHAKEEIQNFFPELVRLSSYCRFRGCNHVSEPGCAVKEALKEKEIALDRYQSYLVFFESAKG
ncbi:MAG: ribosome small subunit-dependent GTPase A [Firmicutes bacterium]|jgi:ribosome biogenesis GTPase|nr:ribosome small subunit-dependent GTPase A [Bacillota bacterium]